MILPNYEDCQECNEWDDVNGCWLNKRNVLTCEKYIKLQNFDKDDEDEKNE